MFFLSYSNSQRIRFRKPSVCYEYRNLIIANVVNLVDEQSGVLNVVYQLCQFQ